MQLSDTHNLPSGSVIIVMGVSGSGKSTVGAALADALGCAFHDADDYHPAANVARMAAGKALDDADRAPWLATLRALIADTLDRGATAVLACSALKHSYRAILRVDAARVRFVYLHGDYATLWQRMAARPGHYMRPDLLASQFATLEEPDAAEALRLSVGQDLSLLVQAILADRKQ